MDKKTVKEGVLQAVVKVAEMECNILYSGWPPPCMGFIYQPRRPKRESKG